MKDVLTKGFGHISRASTPSILAKKKNTKFLKTFAEGLGKEKKFRGKVFFLETILTPKASVCVWVGVWVWGEGGSIK